MARSSQTHSFAFHEDPASPSLESSDVRMLDEASIALNEVRNIVEEATNVTSQITNDVDIVATYGRVQERQDDAANADDERRYSAITRTSISSLPESAYETENELPSWRNERYTPRPNERNRRQIESHKRTHITSLPHIGFSSPRRLGSKSRKGTPRSLRPELARGSPSARRRISEQTEAPDEELKQYPLVLLHVTLLPVDLPWSMESMREVLPAHTLHNLQLLRRKISETVLSRGILIPHPREEYELLEEKLLEALELKEERVTKCGHFRSRNSSSSTTENDDDSDSGVGSSIDGSGDNFCKTCQGYIGTTLAPVGKGVKKWNIRIFAANGLMRASAWAAAWADMESVDVEIQPWISEETRRLLDESKEREEASSKIGQEEAEEERIRRIVDEKVWLLREDMTRFTANARASEDCEFPIVPEPPMTSNDRTESELPIQHSPNAVPDIYTKSQIPISLLLKNYVYLLAQDRRNVAIFLLATITLFLSLILAAPGRPLLHVQEWQDRVDVLPPSMSTFAQNDVISAGRALQEPEMNGSAGDPATSSSPRRSVNGQRRPVVHKHQCSTIFDGLFYENASAYSVCPARSSASGVSREP